MASTVVKFQRCDRCHAEARAEALSVMPNGWGRLITDRKQVDLCWDCVLRATAPPIKDCVEARQTAHGIADAALHQAGVDARAAGPEGSDAG